MALKKLILTSFFCSSSLLAGTGIIIGYRTPVYQEEDISSKKVLILKRGLRVYIHDKHFLKSQSGNQKGFYQTLDTNANIAFIPKEYVKLLTLDAREERNPIPLKPDPTDHRLEGKIPDSYPFVKKTRYRGSFSFATSPGAKESYQYARAVSKVDYQNRFGLSYIFGKGAMEDVDHRLYFGGLGQIWVSSNNVSFTDNSSAKETIAEFHLGPQLSYDFFRNDQHTLSLVGALTVNYNLARMNIDNDQKQRLQNRSYYGLSVSPKVQAVWTQKKFLDDLNLRLGLETQWVMSHNLSTNAVNNDYGYWRSDADQFSVGSHAIWSLFIGFQSEY